MTRNKKLVKMMALAVAASTVATSVPAYAAFDATYYAQQNPDVVAAIGTKPADLEMHYNVFGKKEGRAGSVDEAGSALRQLFDAEYYAKLNPDVVAVYGNDANALFNHFLQFGIKEGRKINPYFDVNAYKKAYPDLVAAFGDDIAAYYNHFATNGIKEHRTLGGFPAEKIVPGGVAVASSGGSSSSSSGGGGGSSKPAPKPAEEQVTPTPDPTPAPQPEPEPEPEPEPVVVPDYVSIENSAKAIEASNAAIEKEIDKFFGEKADGTRNPADPKPITKAQQNALVARTLTALNEADALKTQAAEVLENAETEKETADEALVAANKAVAEAVETNDALANFTADKNIVNNVKVALGSVKFDSVSGQLDPTENKGYYGALENLALAQAAVERAAQDLAEAQSAAAATQKAYDNAYANVKTTYLEITNKTEDYIATLTESQVAGLLAEEAEVTGEFNQSALTTKAGAVNAYKTYNVNNTDIIDITATGFGINKTNYRQSVDGVTKATNNKLLKAAQVAYLNKILTDGENYDDVTVSEAPKKQLNSQIVTLLSTLGFTSAQIADLSAPKDSVPDAVFTTDTFNDSYSAVARKLADSDQFKATKYTISSGDYTTNYVVSVATGDAAKSLAVLQEQEVKTNVGALETALNEYKATSATITYNNALDEKLENDEALDEAEEAKEEADEALEEAKETLKEAETAVAEAKAERDTAYEEAGVAGNAELIARDAALEEAAKEAYELEKTKVANAEAVEAYGDAATNYNDAKNLNPTD